LQQVDEQKKVIRAIEEDKQKLAAAERNMKESTRGEEGSEKFLQNKLAEAERLIKRLRKENESQKKEVQSHYLLYFILCPLLTSRTFLPTSG